MHSALSGARQNDPYFRKASFALLTGYLLKADSIKSSIFLKYFTNQCTDFLNEVFE